MPGRGEWTLVGRDDELKTIEDVVSAQMPGLVLVGDAGVGKTRLLREALARAGEDGVECHWVSATGAARSIPFGAVSHLIPASRRPSADAVGLVATVERDFARRGGGRPVMIGIDDAHLLDEPSAGLLHQLAVHGLAVAVATVRAGDYDNYARTGYGTGDIIAGRAGPDACGNGWGRVASPLGLATARIAKAKADGHNAYHATTGGVNNTNWNTVLTRLSICRALEFAGESLNPTGLFRFEWAAVGGKQGIVTNGGGCNFWLDLPVGEDYYINIAVPRYTGPAQYAGITADATTIVNSLLGAGADKVVWMLYYDITPANIDIGQYGWVKLRSLLPTGLQSYMPAAPVSTLQPLIDPLWVGTVRGVISDLNWAIQLGVPFDPAVRVAFAPPFTPGDIQITAEGGSPHPSPSGQDKLASTLAGVLSGM